MREIIIGLIALFLAGCANASLDRQTELTRETLALCKVTTAAIRVIRPTIPTMDGGQLDRYEAGLDVSDRYCLPGQPIPTTGSALADLRDAASSLNELKDEVQ